MNDKKKKEKNPSSQDAMESPKTVHQEVSKLVEAPAFYTDKETLPLDELELTQEWNDTKVVFQK